MLFIIVVFSGFLKAVMDIITHKYFQSIFVKFPKWETFMNPIESWKNKYKEHKKRVPKFLGSTTIFVAFTDLWHLAQSLHISSLFALIIMYEQLYNPLIDFLLLRSVYTLSFTLFYTYILNITNSIMYTVYKLIRHIWPILGKRTAWILPIVYLIITSLIGTILYNTVDSTTLLDDPDSFRPSFAFTALSASVFVGSIAWFLVTNQLEKMDKRYNAEQAI